jgi:hypothetical protein
MGKTEMSRSVRTFLIVGAFVISLGSILNSGYSVKYGVDENRKAIGELTKVVDANKANIDEMEDEMENVKDAIAKDISVIKSAIVQIQTHLDIKNPIRFDD